MVSLKGESEMLTHEQFIKAVAVLGIGRLEAEQQATLNRAKLTYGAGRPGSRGVTYFDKWLHSDKDQSAFIEICAMGEQNPVQLAGTTLHELGHVLAGLSAGHSKVWKCACEGLGLRRIEAAGTKYQLAMFAPDIRNAVARLIDQLEGAKPINGVYGGLSGGFKPRPCSMGIGTRGGVSRGAGSGSRLRKYVCDCDPPVIIRAARDNLDCTCNGCKGLFKLA